MWAQCGQTHPDACERRRTRPEEKGALTCWNACIHATQAGWLRKAGCTHNPEVAGSNPAPATSEVAGQQRGVVFDAHQGDARIRRIFAPEALSPFGEGGPLAFPVCSWYAGVSGGRTWTAVDGRAGAVSYTHLRAHETDS